MNKKYKRMHVKKRRVNRINAISKLFVNSLVKGIPDYYEWIGFTKSQAEIFHDYAKKVNEDFWRDDLLKE